MNAPGRNAVVASVLALAVLCAVAAWLGARSAPGGVSEEPHLDAGTPGHALRSGSGGRPPMGLGVSRAPGSLDRAADGGPRVALDGGVPGASDPLTESALAAVRTAGGPAPGPGAPAAAPVEPTRPTVRLDHPPTPEEQVEHAGRLHDLVILRRDEVRHRLAEAARAGSPEVARLRRELARLDAAEPGARQTAEEAARRARPRPPSVEAPAPSEASDSETGDEPAVEADAPDNP